MTCIIVVGGQYGSEGKGKVVALYSQKMRSPWVVRCGGPNSGHTVDLGGKPVALRHVPTGVGNPDARLVLSAGCAIDQAVLFAELDALKIGRERIFVDERAVLISTDDKAMEGDIASHIGSTQSGTGAALIRRMTRNARVKLAKQSPELCDRTTVCTTADLLHNGLDHGEDVIVEGTQGFGLSLLHGSTYPFVTARDTTASGFASEVGLSPRAIDQIVVVFRTFPIRVAGNSGPLVPEVTWDKVRELSGAPETMVEYTSVTKRVRRVGLFDMDLAKRAVQFNRPTSLALMGLDRLDHRNHRATDWDCISDSTRRFVADLQEETRVPINLFGTGFMTNEAFWAKAV